MQGIIKLVDKQQDFLWICWIAGRILPGLQVRIVKDGIPQNNLNLGEIQVKGAVSCLVIIMTYNQQMKY